VAHLGVAKILTLKAKTHFFGVGTHMHGGGALATFLGVEGVVYAPVGSHRRLRHHHAEICVLMCRFSAILAVVTPTVATGPGARPNHRHHPVEGAGERPAALNHPHAENNPPGHRQARAAYQNSSVAYSLHHQN
jgi:hypothetical protein